MQKWQNPLYLCQEFAGLRMGIPALDRGLDLLESVITSINPLKYTDLKKSIPGISDSSLNRLITSLIEKEFLEKSLDGYYTEGVNLRKWTKFLIKESNLNELIDHILGGLLDLTNESVGLAKLTDNRIEMIKRINADNSISIIPKGAILHFESDHAGSLAILDSLSHETRISLLENSFSRISSIKEYEEGIEKFKYIDGKQHIYFLDESVSRIGVSRLAVPLWINKELYVLFICAPSQRLIANKEKFIEILIEKSIQLSS